MKLTDFGLAKADMGGESDRTNSFIGTMVGHARQTISVTEMARQLLLSSDPAGSKLVHVKRPAAAAAVTG